MGEIREIGNSMNNISLSFESSGYDDYNRGFCYINGVNYSSNGRGHNIVRVSKNGEFIENVRFDTYADTSDAMADYIYSIPAGDFLIFAVKDATNIKLMTGGKNALAYLGFTLYASGDSYRIGWGGITKIMNNGGSRLAEDLANRLSSYIAIGEFLLPEKIHFAKSYVSAFEFSELGPADGLIGYYPFDTDVNDYSGNNNHGINVGASLSEGIIGNGYDFDGPGGSDYLSIPSGSLAAPYTVSMWLKSDETLSTSTSSLYRRTPLRGDTAWNPGIWLTFGIIRAHAATKYTDVSWSGDTEWHLIGQVYDGTNLWIILDGQLLIGAETAYAPVSISSLIVGNESALGTTYGWNGKIDDFRIYNRALSASEVNILYETTKLQKIKVSSTTLYTNGIIEH